MAKKRLPSKSGAVRDGRSQKMEKAAHDKEFKELEKIAAKYQGKMRQAWARVGGPDEKVVRSELERISKLKDAAERQRQSEEFDRRYVPLIQRGYQDAGIEPAAVRQEILAAVPVPSGARVEHATGPAISWHSEPDLARPAPQPLQSFREIVLHAPYEFEAVLGGQAERSTGHIDDLFNEITIAGSSQHLASVGSSFRADTDVTRVRVEGTIEITSSQVDAVAFFGYASAEVILNIKVLDGTRVVGSNSLSLERVITVVFWHDKKLASGQYTFSVEFDQAPGIPRTYTVKGELETWVGGGGVYTSAFAMGHGTVKSLRVVLITQ